MGAQGIYPVNFTTLSANSTVRLQQIQHTQMRSAEKEYKEKQMLSIAPLFDRPASALSQITYLKTDRRL